MIRPPAQMTQTSKVSIFYTAMVSARELFESQIPVTTGGFELPIRMQEIHSSNPPVVTRICDPNNSRARHHRSLKLGSKLKYLNKKYLLSFLEPFHESYKG